MARRSDGMAVNYDPSEVPSDDTTRDVQYETLAQFAYRNNVPVNVVRDLNPDGVDSDGNITAPSLKVK